MQLFCSDHNLIVEYFENINDQLKGLCKYCAERTKYSTIEVKTVLQNVENKKKQIIIGMDENYQFNIQSLEKLQLLLKKSKKYILQVFKNTSSEIESIQQNLNKKKEIIKECVLNYNTYNERELVNYFYDLQLQIDFEDKKDEIFQNLINLEKPKILYINECRQILQEFPQKYFEKCTPSSDEKDKMNQIFKCTYHNMDIIGIDLNLNANDKRLQCRQCNAQVTVQLTQLEEAVTIWKQQFETRKHQCETFQKQLKNCEQTVLDVFSKKIQNINDKYINFKEKLQIMMNQKQQRVKKIIETLNQSRYDFNSKYIVEELVRIKNFAIKDNQSVDTKLSEFQSFINQISQNFQIQQLKQMFKIIRSMKKLQKMQYEYQLIENEKFETDGICNVLAINNSKTILVVGNFSKIHIFQFNQGKFQLFQTLEDGGNSIICIEFFNYSNSFITAGYDSMIRIWVQGQDNLWVLREALEGHIKTFFCLQLNLYDTLIVSAGFDQCVKFWNLAQNKWVNSQTLPVQLKKIMTMSLNKSGNRLVVYGENQQILVIELLKEWFVKQQIDPKYEGSRLCFIKDDTFVYQIQDHQQIFIYKYDEMYKEFRKKFDWNVGNYYDKDKTCLFPQKFVEQKQLLITRYGYNVNVIKFLKNEFIKAQRPVNFKINVIYGTISNDGEFLITWDKFSETIQVRQYKESYYKMISDKSTKQR